MTKEEIAAALHEMGTLMEVKGENPFRCKAYHDAAAVVEQQTDDLPALIASGELAKKRGIGETMLEKITTLVQRGEHPFLNRLREEVPPGLLDMLKLPGLGVKKVK